MLDTLVPHTHVHALICPLHLTVAVALVLKIVAFVPVARFPFKDSIPVLLVCLIEALVRVALGVAVFVGLLLFPLAVAVFQAAHELPGVTAAILPLVLSEALWPSFCILADIAVAVGKEIGSIAISQALVPLSFILISVCKDMHAVALSFGLDPLANV